MSAAVSVPLPPLVSPPVPPADGPRPWRWTRDQYYALAEFGFFRGKRVELIRGEIVLMSPMKPPHAWGIVLALDALRVTFGSGFTFRPQLPLALGPLGEPEPDLAVVAGSARDHPEHPSTAVLVVEVADATLFYDTTTKAELYAAAGIPDYWVVDLTNRQLVVLRDPAPVGAGGHAYRTRTAHPPADAVAPLAAPDAPVKVADLLP